MLKSYVIRKGRFTEAQKRAYDSFYTKYSVHPAKLPAVPVFPDDNNNILETSQTDFSPVQKLDFKNIFGNDNNVTLEIGFGSGAATVEIAQKNPDKNYLGIEVHRPGIGRLLWEIEKRNLTNIRIIEYDACFVAEKMISYNSLDAIHIFFPDPWPKKRHRKRRLVQRPFTERLADCLKPGGYLYMVTDWEDYAFHALEELSGTLPLKNKYDGFALPQSWRPETRFEKKGIEKNHKIRELYFYKN